MASPRYEPVAQQTGAGRNLITSAQLDALVEDAARKGGDLERLKSARLRIERAGAALRRNAAPPTMAPMDESVEMREPIAPEPSSAIAGSHEQWFPEPEPEPDGADAPAVVPGDTQGFAPPDLTWLGGLLSKRDGGATALAKALYAVHAVGTLVWVVGYDYRRWTGFEGDTGFNIVSAYEESAGDPRKLIQLLSMGAQGATFLYMFHALRSVTKPRDAAGPDSDSGGSAQRLSTLQRLGAGRLPLSQTARRCLLLWAIAVGIYSLAREVLYHAGTGIPSLLNATFAEDGHADFAWTGADGRLIFTIGGHWSAWLVNVLWNLLAVPVFAVFAYMLPFVTVLCTHRVDALTAETIRLAPQLGCHSADGSAKEAADQAWTEGVARPAMELTRQSELLTEGFGKVSLVILAFAFVSVFLMSGSAYEMDVALSAGEIKQSGHGMFSEVIRAWLTGMVSCVVVFVSMFIPHAVKNLRGALNDVRIMHEADATLHLKIEAVEAALGGVNEGEGIGLKAPGIGVINSSSVYTYLQYLVVSVVPAALGAISQVHNRSEERSCELTAEQQGLLDGMAGQFNSSCVFNVTLSAAAP